jgi:S1-C subfamily serine protease
MISKLHPAILLLAFAAVCAPVYAAHADESFDLPKLAKATRQAVVYIVVFDEDDKPFASGSGFFVSADGKLITNAHVIKDAHSALVKTDNGQVLKVSKVIARNTQLDFALLQVDVKDAPFLKLGDDQAMEVGQRIAIIGSPLGMDGTLSEGIISAKRDDDGVPWLQITAPISHGSSGSPVMNAHGEVIGVATAISDGQAMNFAIPISIPKTLLANYLKSPNQSSPQLLSTPPASQGTSIPPATASSQPTPSSSPLPPDDTEKDDPAYKREHPLTAVELSQEQTSLGRRVKQELSDQGSAGAVYKQYLMKFWKQGSP